MPRKSSINIGDRFGRLVVLEDLGTRGSKNRSYLCYCDCGNKSVVTRPNLLRHTRSCGCIRIETARKNRGSEPKHGMAGTRVYRIWNKMRQRCCNQKDKRYEDYGGRGIRVCDDWQKFEPFWEWAQANGYNDTLSIDRIDVNGDYCPENCRWADAKTQANNTRSNKRYTVQEKVLTESQWCRELGVSSSTIAAWQRRHGEAYVIQRIEQALREREEKE